jgi:hypothetical protein
MKFLQLLKNEFHPKIKYIYFSRKQAKLLFD